jgi:hypothetical protein
LKRRFDAQKVSRGNGLRDAPKLQRSQKRMSRGVILTARKTPACCRTKSLEGGKGAGNKSNLEEV